MKINSDLFPHGIAGAIADTGTFGKITNKVFSYPASILRVMGGFNMINLVYQSTQPTSPVTNMVWMTPATLSSGVLSESEVKIYNGVSWVDPTPSLWNKAFGGSGDTPVNPNQPEPNNPITYDPNTGTLIIDDTAVLISATYSNGIITIEWQ